MGIEKFSDSMKEWLRRIYADKAFILGQSRASREAHFPSPWPPTLAEQKVEIPGRIYDLYNLSSDAVSREDNLKSATYIKGLDSYVKKAYQVGGRAGYDSDFLHYMVKSVADMLDAPIIARIYVSFNHSNLKDARNVGNYLQRELKFKTRGIVKFKIAGPEMPNARRDSVVIWITGRGVAVRGETAKTIQSIVKTLRDTTVYGASRILPRVGGIGFTYEPKELPAHDWKLAWNDGRVVSFGSLISIYLARGLREASGSLDAFADKVAVLMNADGIDPLNVGELSIKTRQ